MQAFPLFDFSQRIFSNEASEIFSKCAHPTILLYIGSPNSLIDRNNFCVLASIIAYNLTKEEDDTLCPEEADDIKKYMRLCKWFQKVKQTQSEFCSLRPPYILPSNKANVFYENYSCFNELLINFKRITSEKRQLIAANSVYPAKNSTTETNDNFEKGKCSESDAIDESQAIELQRKEEKIINSNGVASSSLKMAEIAGTSTVMTTEHSTTYSEINSTTSTRNTKLPGSSEKLLEIEIIPIYIEYSFLSHTSNAYLEKDVLRLLLVLSIYSNLKVVGTSADAAKVFFSNFTKFLLVRDLVNQGMIKRSEYDPYKPAFNFILHELMQTQTPTDYKAIYEISANQNENSNLWKTKKKEEKKREALTSLIQKKITMLNLPHEKNLVTYTKIELYSAYNNTNQNRDSRALSRSRSKTNSRIKSEKSTSNELHMANYTGFSPTGDATLATLLSPSVISVVDQKKRANSLRSNKKKKVAFSDRPGGEGNGCVEEKEVNLNGSSSRNDSLATNTISEISTCETKNSLNNNESDPKKLYGVILPSLDDETKLNTLIYFTYNISAMVDYFRNIEAKLSVNMSVTAQTGEGVLRHISAIVTSLVNVPFDKHGNDFGKIYTEMKQWIFVTLLSTHYRTFIVKSYCKIDLNELMDKNSVKFNIDKIMDICKWMIESSSTVKYISGLFPKTFDKIVVDTANQMTNCIAQKLKKKTQQKNVVSVLAKIGMGSTQENYEEKILQDVHSVFDKLIKGLIDNYASKILKNEK